MPAKHVTGVMRRKGYKRIARKCIVIYMSKMKPKTKAFLDKLLSDPKIDRNKAWMETHNTNNPRSAAATAAEVLARPSSQLYLQQHIDKAKERIVSLVDSNREDIALKASESILDRELGKPIVKQQIQSTRISISLGDLQG